MPNTGYDGRQAFPTLDVGGQVEGEVYAPSLRRDVPEGLDQLAQRVEGVGNVLGQMADRAAGNEARAQASVDAANGGDGVVPQNPNTVYGQTYNDVAKQSLGEQRKAVMAQSMGEAYAANPADPAALDKALTATKAGLASTPFPDLNQELDNQYLTHRATLMTQAQEGLRRTMMETQAGNYQLALQTGANVLDQSAAGATFDAAGAARISAGLATFQDGLAKYGPRTDFQINGKDYPADPSRAGAISPEQIAAHVGAAVGEAKRTWFQNAQLAIHTADGRAKFADDARARYQAGDPVFAGLDGQQAESLFQNLDAGAAKAANDEKATAALHAHNAEQLMETIQWGGTVDPHQLETEAQASGDPGIMAKAAFFGANPGLKGVLARTVYNAEHPNAGGGLTPQALDARGNPLPPANANNNPGNLRPLTNGQWDGQTGVAGGFAQFATPEAGAAAADKNLVAKQTLHHLTTLNQIIGDPTYGWAPAADHNNPGAYAAAVGKFAGVDPNAPIDLVGNPQLRAKVLAGIFRQESGGSGPAAAPPSGPEPATAATPPTGAAPGSPAYLAWANTRAGFSSDPLKFAYENGIKAPTPMDPSGAFSTDTSAAANWGAAMRQRMADGKVIAAGYGVPARMLTDPEKDAIKSQLASNPGLVVDFARRATAALGPAGATQLLREVGTEGDLPTVMHIGNLAAMGNLTIANAAQQGLALKAAGAKDPPENPMDKLDTVQAMVAPAFRYAPSVLVAARNTADLARLSDGNRGIQHSSLYYLNSAVGATSDGQGHTFGGFANVNGQTVLPTWLRSDQAQPSLRAIGDSWASHPGTGPVYANGQPMSGKDVARMQPVMRPDGTYWLVNPSTNQLARLGNGHIATLDFDAQRGFLTQVLPGAVKPGR